ncbi:alcohol acetyltransferase [Talaromyces proteolyticus]|uniref:Alcohol acetyltransferase n=1 Tax=Talaromyces proteolyticus TaxID=1131652 RepID=A0AAD4KRS2_9EURO|nr:alcohol acetyltransferase [Talaromyces proteolyticus]KAH8698960.1 alcohol acetyltransferase [Talaromyces proteolyticus]
MSTSEPMKKLRNASKTEKRFTVRHALGWYHSIVISGLYNVESEVTFDTTSISSYIPALKWCIEAHPILSAVIHGEDSEYPEFFRPTNLDLQNHVEIIDSTSTFYTSEDELELLKQVTLEIHDRPWLNVERVPSWKIIVLPLPHQSHGTKKRVYILYAYSHTHGDGKSGLAFHRSFFEGLKHAHLNYDQSLLYSPPLSQLPKPLEESCVLRVSWTYLLSPFLAQYFPSYLSRWLGLYSSPTSQSTSAYIGEPVTHNPESFHTGSQILLVDRDLLGRVLTVCREHGAKFTGLFNQLVVRALSEMVRPETGPHNFVGAIVLDLRPLISTLSNDTMGNYVSAMYEYSPRISGDTAYPEAFWGAVRKTTSRLKDAAGTLNDQPIGLLKYLGNVRSWYLKQLGQDRNLSYEISNLGIFDPSLFAAMRKSEKDNRTWEIGRVIFSQPANVTAAPLNFQIVTLKDADMVITLNWQIGVLGVPNENSFTEEILTKVKGMLGEVVFSS